MTRHPQGFALIEFTLVLGVLATLTTLALSLAHGQQINQHNAERAITRVSAQRTLDALGRYYWSHCQGFGGVYPPVTVDNLVSRGYLGSAPPTHTGQPFALTITPAALSVMLPTVDPVSGEPVRLTAHPALLRGDQRSWRYRTIFEAAECE